LRFFGDEAAKAAFARALTTLASLGVDLVELDYTPFAETARLLYEGPWVAERLAAIKAFFAASSEHIDPVVRKIIATGAEFTAADAFEGQYRLEALRQQCGKVWKDVDMLVVPTAGTIYRIDEVLADPFALNANLGYYTNFVNLLDLAAVAVPAKFRDDGLPCGITLIAPALEDAHLLREAARFQRAAQTPLGATAFSLPPADEEPVGVAHEGIVLAVVGAHLSGMPLNHQLTSRGARLLAVRSTSPHYRLYALAGTAPPKPGLARALNGSGVSIVLELWDVPAAAFGAFVAEVPPPLAIGTVMLDDGSEVKGFVCESYALEGARDISGYGGWRNYMKDAK
jgi:allophanate hydrolase